MNHSQLLDEFSNKIYNLGDDDSEATNGIKVYQDNLFHGAIDKLGDVFLGFSRYVGDNNFAFFVRAFLIEHRIRSLSWNTTATDFASFVEAKRDIHQDDKIPPLLHIDLLWNEAGEHSRPITVSLGSLNLWKLLYEENFETAATTQIDSNGSEIVSVEIEDGDMYLKSTPVQSPEGHV